MAQPNLPELEQMLKELQRYAETLMGAAHRDPAIHRRLRGKDLQDTWTALLTLALFGKNMASGGNIHESGEEIIFNLLKRLDQPGTQLTLLDLGANRGDWSAQALQQLGAGCRVVALEPDPENAASLKQRLGSDSRFTLLQLAAGETPGKLPFFAPGSGTTMGSLIQRDLRHEKVSFEFKHEVEVVRLDDLCRKEHIDRIHLLKIDTEGADFAVLRGSKELMSAHAIRMIQFEFGSPQIDGRTFFKDFWDLLSPNYRIYRIVADGLVEIDQYWNGLEIFWCTNYLAVARE